MQNTDSPAVLQTAGEGRQVRLRLGLRHDQPTARRRTWLGRHQLGAVLHQGGPRRARRQVEDRQGLVGRQGRRDRPRVDRRRGAGRAQGQGRGGQGRPERRQLRRSGRARSSTRTARKCSRRTRSPTTSSWAASTSTSRASKARCPATSEVGYCAAAMRRWPVLGILTYLQYVPVPARRPPSLTAARYAAKGHPTGGLLRCAFLRQTLGHELLRRHRPLRSAGPARACPRPSCTSTSRARSSPS